MAARKRSCDDADDADGADGADGHRNKRAKRAPTIEHSRRLVDPAGLETQVVAAASIDNKLVVLDEDGGIYNVGGGCSTIDPDHQLTELNPDGQPDGVGDFFETYCFGPTGLDILAIASERRICPLVVAGKVANPVTVTMTDGGNATVTRLPIYDLPKGAASPDVIGALMVDNQETVVVMVRAPNGTEIVVPDAGTGTVPLRVDGDNFSRVRGHPLHPRQLSNASMARIVGGAIITVDVDVDNGNIIIMRNGRLQSTVPSSVTPPSSFFISSAGKIAWIAGACLYSVHMGQPTLLASNLPDTACFHHVGGESTDFGAIIDNIAQPQHVDMIDFRSAPPAIVASLVVPLGLLVGSVFPHGEETVFVSDDDDDSLFFYPLNLN